MSFRISCEDRDGGTLLRIDGRLDQDGLGEFERAYETMARPLTLDLSGLRLADEPALEALRRLELGGAQLIGASQYLALRLKPRRQGP